MSAVFRLAALCFALTGLVIGLASIIDGFNTTNLVLSILLIHGSICLFFAFRKHTGNINRIQACVFLVIIWIGTPLPLAVALTQVTTLDFIDAYFEMGSAFTTSGASVLTINETTEHSVLFLRGIAQWLGGLLTLLGAVLIIAPCGLGGLPNTQSSILTKNNLLALSNARDMTTTIAAGYTAVTIACFFALVFSLVPANDAIYLAFSIVSSGGMITSATPLPEIGGIAAPSVMAFFMIIAGTSILWQRQLLFLKTEQLVEHREVYYYGIAILVVALIYALTFQIRAGSTSVLNPLLALQEGLFTAASLISTTGMEIRNGSFGVLPVTAVLTMALIGGCAFSTAGGVSFYRVGGMLTYSFRDLSKLVYPSSVHSERFGSQRYTMSKIKAIWSYFFAVMVVIILGVLFVSLELATFEASLIASIAAFSNMGGLYATGWSETGQWLPFSEMDDFTKVVLVALMTLGRLHILVLLTALNRTYWRRSR